MRTLILLLGTLLLGGLSPAQSYKYGEMIQSSTETHTYHGVARKIFVYRIKNSIHTYTVTQWNTNPSELASRKLVEFRIDQKNRWVMYIKDKSEKEVKYSILSLGSLARGST